MKEHYLEWKLFATEPYLLLYSNNLTLKGTKTPHQYEYISL